MKKPTFPPEFFYDEVRDGFFVSEMMKRFWAAQLVVLYEIVKICDRHSIPWYADMGTLLGAIRHKGYIPWDDDLDISMNRVDWERFFEYAADELPEGYHILTVRRNEEYSFSLGRVTCSDNINLNRDHMEKYYGCPYCVGVDIFPIDRLYKDPKKEQDRKDRGKAIKKAFDLMDSVGMEAEETKKVLAGIERDNHVILHRNNKIRRELILLFEKICMECHDMDYDQVALTYTWIIGDWANCPRHLYEDRIEVPFENTTLMVTKDYDELLNIYYPDYMTIRRGGGVHDYPTYGSQEQILKENIGHNPYRYTFTKDDLSLVRKEKSFANVCHDIMEMLEKSLNHCRMLSEQGDCENVNRLLTGSQDLAITLGTNIEGKFGEDCSIIKTLEEYCELLYRASLQMNDEIYEELSKVLEEIKVRLNALLNGSIKEVVFLPCTTLWWDTMRPAYEKMLGEKDVNVKVIPLPLYDRNPYGEIGGCHDESDHFKALSGYTLLSDYDIEKRHPDIIVMQVPFDSSSCAMTVPPKYYSDNLLKCCDELWYIPCYAPDPPESADDKAAAAIPVLIEQPAVVNADKVIIENEALRNLYIERLIAMSGEDTREYWKNKIQELDRTG